MNPETAHKVTLWGLRLAEKMRVLPLVMGEVPSDPVEILGMKFPNRVGLAAGMDKEADTVSAFGQAGFGFVEVGTLTPRPQPGNEKPRLFRLIPQKAIINRMGLTMKVLPPEWKTFVPPLVFTVFWVSILGKIK